MTTELPASLTAKLPSGVTQVYGIMGWPVSESLSPTMQTTALSLLGIDAQYVAFPVRPGTVAQGMAGLFGAGVRGLNVTAPLKQEAAEACVRRSPSAERAASVNTLIRTDGGWEGDTTDGEGFVSWLTSIGLPPRGSTL